MIERLPATLLDGGDARAEGAGEIPLSAGTQNTNTPQNSDLVGRTQHARTFARFAAENPRTDRVRHCDVNRETRVRNGPGTGKSRDPRSPIASRCESRASVVAAVRTDHFCELYERLQLARKNVRRATAHIVAY